MMMTTVRIVMLVTMVRMVMLVTMTVVMTMSRTPEALSQPSADPPMSGIMVPQRGGTAWGPNSWSGNVWGAKAPGASSCPGGGQTIQDVH